MGKNGTGRIPVPGLRPGLTCGAPSGRFHLPRLRMPLVEGRRLTRLAAAPFHFAAAQFPNDAGRPVPAIKFRVRTRMAGIHAFLAVAVFKLLTPNDGLAVRMKSTGCTHGRMPRLLLCRRLCPPLGQVRFDRWKEFHVRVGQEQGGDKFAHEPRVDGQFEIGHLPRNGTGLAKGMG